MVEVHQAVFDHDFPDTRCKKTSDELTNHMITYTYAKSSKTHGEDRDKSKETRGRERERESKRKKRECE